MATTAQQQQQNPQPQAAKKPADKSPIISLFEKMLTIINSGAGRDKTCRVLQYAIMALLPTLKARGAHFNELSDRLNKLKGSMSATRKVLRFGKEIPLLTNIRNNLAKHEVSPVRMILYKVLNDIALALYFFTDHPLYFNNVGFWKYSPTFIKKCDYINNIFWLLNSIFDIVVTVEEINYQRKQMRKVANQLSGDKSPADDAMKQQLRQQLRELRILVTKAWLNLFRNLFDLPAIFYFLNSPRISQTQAGICGTITSCISLYGMWGTWQ